MDIQPKRVAVIGGGCTGISSFWALQNSNHDVHLFEASARLGGRIKPLSFKNGDDLVEIRSPLSFNAKASPNLVSLLYSLRVPISAARFGFCVSTGTDTLEWDLGPLRTVIRHPRMLCNLETFRILFDLIRFKYRAADVLAVESRPDNCHGQLLSTVREYLAKEGFSNSFRDKYLVPLLSMLWGSDAGSILPHFPIEGLCWLLYRHGFLAVSHSGPQWKRVNFGAEQFIQRMERDFPAAKVHLKTRILAVKPCSNGRFTLLSSDGLRWDFDHVVFAVDARESIRILGPAVAWKELRVLQELQTSNHIAVLHSDPCLMPQPSRVPFAYIKSNDFTHPGPPKACLTYNVDTRSNTAAERLARVSVTLDPFTHPRPQSIHRIWEYSDWNINPTTLGALRLLPSIQDKRGLSFCALWTGSGFFEDSVTAGLAVAVDHLGAELPFVLDHDRWDEMNLKIPRIGIRGHLVRTLVDLVRAYILILEIFWSLLQILHVSVENMARNSRKEGLF